MKMVPAFVDFIRFGLFIRCIRSVSPFGLVWLRSVSILAVSGQE